MTNPQPSLQQPEDTNAHPAIYEVWLILAQRSSGRVLIEAASFEDAQRKAEKIQMDEVDNWEIFEDILDVEAVETMNGGNSNE